MHSSQAEAQSVAGRWKQRHSTVFVRVQPSQVQALLNTARRLALHQLAQPELQEALAIWAMTILLSGTSREQPELADQTGPTRVTITREMTHLHPQHHPHRRAQLELKAQAASGTQLPLHTALKGLPVLTNKRT